MTVTLTTTGSGNAIALKVDAVTGQHASSYVGATNTGTTTTNNATINAYTSTAAASRGFCAAIDMSSAGAVTSTDDESAWTGTVSGFFPVAGMAIRKAANTATSGTGVTFNLDAAGSSAAEWYWAALEIKPASTDASVETTTVAIATSVPDPATSVGSSPVPATVPIATTVPAPAVSAGAGASAGPAAVAVDIPAPSVSTEETEVAAPDTVAVTTTVPTPGVDSTVSLVPATVPATVDLPAPAVQVHADVTLDVIGITVAVPTPTVTVPVLPGDRVARAGQIEWNGTLLGSGTPYSWQELAGWRDCPPIISGNVDQPTGHGSYAGQPYAGERIINWSTLMKAPRAEIAQAVDDLQMATGLAQTEDEGSLVIWDFDLGAPYLVYAHLSDRKPGTINKQARLGLMRGVIQWTCSDPRLYGVIRQSATIARDIETEVLNDGNEASPRVVIRIPGPTVTPQIENPTLDRVIAFNVSVADGEVLEIDVKLGTAVIGATDHVSDLIEGSTSIPDFVLGAGANVLLFTADSGGAAGMDILWRHART
ncbi:hypothetical protein Pve01_66960 [Planomonospora venezuelensis]|nr:hypothetical protein Pve01_66960 [Planomonospora venezuelensis]